MKRLVSMIGALLLLQGCNQASAPAPPQPSATVRLAAVPGRPAAGYFELRVQGDRGALLSVTSPQAGRMELHETMDMGNMSTMRPLDRVPVRDGETLRFAPGGRHLMIYDLAPNLAAGGRIDLVLHFERGDPVTLAATLVPAGGEIGL
jgi:periplasmic copper chaperone A